MRPRRSHAAVAALGLLAILAACAPQVREWSGDSIAAIEQNNSIVTAEGRIILNGKDYGPHAAGDRVRLTTDGSGNAVLTVNGETRTPTGVPVPESILPQH